MSTRQADPDFRAPLATRLKRRLRPAAGGCLEWQGQRLRSGHGRIWSRGEQRQVLTHRAAWEAANGPIPDGMFVLHRCDNPPCCNPGHLFLGTQADNMADMAQKGRRRGRLTGEVNPKARLSAANVAEIRRLSSAGVVQREIAARFAVDRSTVGRIVRGQLWPDDALKRLREVRT